MPDQDELDLLLDSALSTYADPGPDSGLEHRVLAAIDVARHSGERPRVFAKTRRWLPWAIAVPVAAGLLLLWLSIPKSVHAPTSTQQFAERHQPPENISSTAHPSQPLRKAVHPSHHSAQAMHPSAPAQVARAMPLPKLDVFPTPAPLSAEERVLVTVADTGPPSEREALIESQEPPDAPLSIAALNIPPLAAPGGGKN